MPIQIPAYNIQPGDQVVICGRPEAVTRVGPHGEYVPVYVPDDPSDPYLFRPAEMVPLLARNDRPV